MDAFFASHIVGHDPLGVLSCTAERVCDNVKVFIYLFSFVLS